MQESSCRASHRQTNGLHPVATHQSGQARTANRLQPARKQSNDHGAALPLRKTGAMLPRK